MNAHPHQRILVTGAASGIGAAVARHLSQQGHQVILADIDADALQAQVDRLLADGLDAVSRRLDVRSWDDCSATMSWIESHVGALDGLVQCAGVIYLGQPWDEQDGQRVQHLLAVNLLGTYQMGALALGHMKAKGRGAIVNFSSGAQAGMAGCAAYCASKAGVAGLTYAWALDVAGTGVRVNALCPVATTPMTEQTNAYLRQRGQLSGSRPYIDPAVNAPAVAFLLSERAAHVTGQVLRVHENQLQLLSHPAVALPVMIPAGPTVDAIAEALDTGFPGGLMPLGLCGAEIRHAPLAKSHQVPR
ncbi:SDR family NAD(P)-dependent oxidoreductase [uncultured Pseudacidovorax sp.]|uniref:SDR family NAD(P)-dependent oxidoreductase n=1 Tax=uncultured Pseudacidovorax sp. TaxID=679313 RepID=UPI0025D9291B|nr:SDR family oxidoreductase [uncultured Pseudacidovorax sp.]